MPSTYERRQQLTRALGESPRVSVQELRILFAVSAVTIRKDLAWLEERKLIVRTHGGAMLMRAGQVEQGFEIRAQMQAAEKERIGQLAASLVQDGDAIALDSSTTALALARNLHSKRELTIISNGLRVGMELACVPTVAVLLPGGMLRRESLSLVGTWGTAVLERVNIKTAFVGARGISLREGLTEVSSEEVAFKRMVIEAARDIVVLVDHSKWDQVAFATFCPIERVKLIITDDQAPAAILKQLRDKGIEVMIA